MQGPHQGSQGLALGWAPVWPVILSRRQARVVMFGTMRKNALETSVTRPRLKSGTARAGAGNCAYPARAGLGHLGHQPAIESDDGCPSGSGHSYRVKKEISCFWLPLFSQELFPGLRTVHALRLYLPRLFITCTSHAAAIS